MTGRDQPGAPDLRLAGFALGTWLAALAALYLSARAGVLLGVAALVLGGVVAVERLIPGPGAARWIAVAVLLGAGGGAVVTGVRVAVRTAGPLVALVEAGHPVRIEAVVRDDPRALRGSPGRPPTYLIAVDLRTVQGDGPPVRMSARAVVLGGDPGWRGLLPGQQVTAAGGKLLPPRGGDLRAAVVSIREPPGSGRPASVDPAGRGCAACRPATCLRAAGRRRRRAAAGIGGGGHQPVGPGARGGLPHDRNDPLERCFRGERRHHFGRGAVRRAVDTGRAGGDGAGLCGGAGRVRDPGAAVTERGAGGGDGRDRPARPGVRAAPGGVAGVGGRGGGTDLRGPGAGGRSRLRAVRAGHRRSAAARAGVAGRAAPPRLAGRGGRGAGGAGRGPGRLRPGDRRAVGDGEPGRGAGEPARGAGHPTRHPARRHRGRAVADLAGRGGVRGLARLLAGEVARAGGHLRRPGARGGRCRGPAAYRVRCSSP